MRRGWPWRYAYQGSAAAAASASTSRTVARARERRNANPTNAAPAYAGHTYAVPDNRYTDSLTWSHAREGRPSASFSATKKSRGMNHDPIVQRLFAVKIATAAAG